MPSNPTPTFGVQSYCFRNFSNNLEVAKKVREIGLDKIELCDVHGDLKDPVTLKHISEIYREGGVSVISIGVQTFIGDDSEIKWFESAKAAGASHISCHFRVDSYLRAIPKVRRWARQFDIRVGIHCHGGYVFGGQPDVLSYLLDLGGPEIGLCIDTAWALQIGPGQGNPVEWAKRFAGRIYGIHYKDFIFERNGRWKDVVVGTGNLDLPAFNAAMREGGFNGMAVIEYEGDADNPVPSLKACVESMLKSESSIS